MEESNTEIAVSFGHGLCPACSSDRCGGGGIGTRVRAVTDGLAMTCEIATAELYLICTNREQ